MKSVSNVPSPSVKPNHVIGVVQLSAAEIEKGERVAQKGDNFWKIAEALLGPGAKKKDIAKLTKDIEGLNPQIDPFNIKWENRPDGARPDVIRLPSQKTETTNASNTGWGLVPQPPVKEGIHFQQSSAFQTAIDHDVKQLEIKRAVPFIPDFDKVVAGATKKVEAATTFPKASASQPTVAPAAIVVPTRASNPNQIFRPMNVLQFDRRVTELLIAQQKKQYSSVNPELQKSYTDVLEEIKEVSAPGFVEPARSKTLAMMELNLLTAMISQLATVESSPEAETLVEEMRARGVTVSGELHRINLEEEKTAKLNHAAKLRAMKF